jgi:hypothetical protein
LAVDGTVAEVVPHDSSQAVVHIKEGKAGHIGSVWLPLHQSEGTFNELPRKVDESAGLPGGKRKFCS